MKRIKRVAAFMLALIMALAMSVTAFADEPGSGDNGENPGNTPSLSTGIYEIYQIFTGEYEATTDDKGEMLTAIKWGKNGKNADGSKVTVGDTVPDGVLEALKAVINETSDTEKLKIIEQYVDLTSDPYRTGNDTSYENVAPGYYLIKNRDGSLESDEAYTTYVVQVVDTTLSFTPKADVPTPDKKIVEKDNNGEVISKVDANSAAIGEVISYEITGTIPDRIDDYATYYYGFTDTLSKGLTLQATYPEDATSGVIASGVTVKIVNGTTETDATMEFTINASAYDKEKGTTITITAADLKAIATKLNVSLTKDTKIVVTYDAKLNENAIVGGTGNPNSVKLEYSNDPKDSNAKGESPEKEVVTYTTELGIIKVDNENKPLTGVEFTLEGNGIETVLVTEEGFVEDANGTYYKLKDGTYTESEPENTATTNNTDLYESTTVKYKKVTVVSKEAKKPDNDTGDVKRVVGMVDENGRLKFTGLSAGHYTLIESKTPAGYNTIENIEFDIKEKVITTADGSSIEFYIDGTGSVKDDIVRLNTNTFEVTIVNTQDIQLPSTGGIGTTIFYVIGGILVVAAGILLVVKKRMQAE